MTLLDRLRFAFASEKAGHILLPHRAIWRAWRRRRPPPSLSAARSILVVRLDEIGDVVLSSAFFRELRRNAPRARITAVVKPACADLLAACPYLDTVETFHAPSGSWDAAHYFALRRAVIAHNVRRFFSRRFDLILLPRRNPDHRDGEFLAFSSGLAFVAALDDFAAPANRDGRYRRSFSEARYPVTRPLHDGDYGLALLENLGGKILNRAPEAWTHPADQADAVKFLATHFNPAQPFAVLHPSGGNSALKQWPVANFATVAHSLALRHGLQWLVIGGADESRIREKFPLTDSPRIVPAPGSLSLRTLTAVLAHARLFIGGDSGPMHLAAAAGTPLVAVFGPTSESRFAPLGATSLVVSSHLSCSPDRTGTLMDRCAHCIYSEPRCLTELTVQPVLEAAHQLLAANPPVRASSSLVQ